MTDAALEPEDLDAAEPEAAPEVAIGYDEFGMRFMNLVLHRDRVMESINRVLGDEFRLGPIGAGPGRKVAKVTAAGTFGTAYGDALPDVVGYQVNLPVHVSFHLDLGVDMLRFDADVLLPLRLTMELVQPLTILWHITPPSPDDVEMTIASDSRRATVLQKLTGLDGELRRFIVRFVDRELEKPHVRKAMRIDLVTVIDNAWEHLASQFMPNGPQDRVPPGERG
ncbi:MAG: hypothetical protein J7518_16125 [Nocardioidaceae bacterium]|nr:hypothetical protein [Nocardioidaceae bacterium]